MQAKRLYFPILTLASLVIVILGFASPALSSVLPIAHWKTQNGVPVYFVAKPEIPLIDIGIVFHAGSAYDGTLPGLAYFTAQMLNQGTDRHSVGNIADRFESLGARYHVDVDHDQAVFQLRSLSQAESLNPALEIFSELMNRASFPTSAVSRVKGQIDVALSQEQQMPSAIARNALYKDLYNQHPYASPVLGTLDSLAHINQTKLIDFYRRYYVAQNATIAIVGDITQSQANALAEQLAATLPQGQKALPTPTPSPSASLSETPHKIYYPSQQTTILLGQIAITLKDPDYFPLLLGNQILGGGALTSQLFSEVRDKRGLCYNIASRFHTLKQAGPFVIHLQTRHEQASTALSITTDTVKKFVTRGPTETELSLAKQALVGSFPLSIASDAAILAILERIGFYELPLTYLDDYRRNLLNIRIAQIRRALQKYPNPSQLTVVMVGQR